ncbi:MAG: ACT domain-containing protein [Ignavibacteriae bacterium HGW-Ignavibacteriae-2]|nr:ACT domain-containing protein [Bacteroidota bacterium]PKL88607.1 MAG: ACT domain-containing protein [Ignavibacteriae bacterium HGW-Ignavibacteriae-2]
MRISEEEIRKIALRAIEELGNKATPDMVREVVQKSFTKLGTMPEGYSEKDISTGRIILTSFGFNQPGIIATITKTLSDAKIDIKDLSQKIMDEFYTMIMLIDISNSPKDLKELQEDMAKCAENLKVKIFIQHEDLFRYMHRI